MTEPCEPYLISFVFSRDSENELSKNILSINVAGESDGGEGALIIKLRNL